MTAHQAVGSPAPEFEFTLHDPRVVRPWSTRCSTWSSRRRFTRRHIQDVNLALWIRAERCQAPQFQSTVLRVQEDRCSFCGYEVRLVGSTGRHPFGPAFQL